jgi:hypothetical protein
VAKAVVAMPSAVDALRELGEDPMVAALAAVPGADRNRKAARGTDVHTWAVEVVHGRELEAVPEDLRLYVDGYARWLDRFDLQPTFTECMVGNRAHWYAGRTDVFGTLGADSWAFDVKTGGVYGEAALQLAAYAMAEFWQDPDGTVHDMVPVDRIGVLSVTEAGTELFDMGDIPTAFGEFLAARAIHTSTTRRKHLVGDPVSLEDAMGLDPVGGLF